MKRFCFFILSLLVSGATVAQTWIWFPGDMDIWTGNRLNTLRTEGGGMWPALGMYGHPYGKSLCHAWGASPLYLLGKYFLGVRPVKPGYA